MIVGWTFVLRTANSCRTHFGQARARLTPMDRDPHTLHERPSEHDCNILLIFDGPFDLDVMDRAT